MPSISILTSVELTISLGSECVRAIPLDDSFFSDIFSGLDGFRRRLKGERKLPQLLEVPFLSQK